jgi:hypothetical protein
MEIQTWVTVCGEWKAQCCDLIAKGETRESAIASLQKKIEERKRFMTEIGQCPFCGNTIFKTGFK